MNKAKLYLLPVMCIFCLNSVAQVNKPASFAFIERSIPGKATSFLIEELPQQQGKDVFEIDNKNGKIVLRGNNGIAIASALNYY